MNPKTCKQLATLITALLLSLASNAQSLHIAGARETGLANSSLTLNSTWSVFHNPAGLTNFDNYSLGISYINRFQSSELSTSAIAGIIPTEKGSFGIGYSYFGTSNYNQQKSIIGYAHKLGEKVDAGISIDLYSTHLPNEYESAHAITGEVGLTVRPINQLSIGAHLNNIAGADYSDYLEQEVPMSFRSSATWTAENYLLSGQLSLNKNYDAVLSVGTEVSILQYLDIRAGVSTFEPMSFTCGLGYHQKRLQLDLAFARHPSLGYTSVVSANINFGQVKR